MTEAPERREGGRNPGRLRGFTLVELCLALVFVGSVLVFMVGGLLNMVRHLTHSELEIQALSLATGKVLEWEEMVHQGGHPLGWPLSGGFEGDPELAWQAEVTPLGIDPSLYQLKLKVMRRGKPEPLVGIWVEGRRSEERLEKEES